MAEEITNTDTNTEDTATLKARIKALEEETKGKTIAHERVLRERDLAKQDVTARDEKWNAAIADMQNNPQRYIKDLQKLAGESEKAPILNSEEGEEIPVYVKQMQELIEKQNGQIRSLTGAVAKNDGTLNALRGNYATNLLEGQFNASMEGFRFVDDQHRHELFNNAKAQLSNPNLPPIRDEHGLERPQTTADVFARLKKTSAQAPEVEKTPEQQARERREAQLDALKTLNTSVGFADSGFDMGGEPAEEEAVTHENYQEWLDKMAAQNAGYMNRANGNEGAVTPVS